MSSTSVAIDSSSTHHIRWFKFASPAHFYALAGRLIPWLLWAFMFFGTSGLAIGFLYAPSDAQQGDAYRILYLHVPAAWLSMLMYLAMAAWCVADLIWNTRLSAMLARAIAPTGAMFTFLALWTGALWGKPTWGAWWVWDARLTSELILLFLYLGFMALQAAIDDTRRADKAGALLALVGVINIPIIYFSVQWWNTLHQGSSISLRSAPSMPGIVLRGVLLATLGFWSYALAASLQRVRSIILERESATKWVTELRGKEA